MAKVSKKFEKLTPFGGNYFTNRAFSSLSLDKVINETLGKRSSTYNGYQWDEIVSSMLDVYLSGGNCVEDVNRKECHIRETPDTRIPTSHTVGRAIKTLSTLSFPQRKRTYLIITLGALMTKGQDAIQMPSPGAVCPAIVTSPDCKLSWLFKKIVPDTSKIMVRAPF